VDSSGASTGAMTRETHRPCALRTTGSDYSYGSIPPKQMSLGVRTHNNVAMSDTALPVAVCCYKNRAVAANRCDFCEAEYACPEFKSKAAVMQFNAMIPPSMLLSPLPIELWPSMCADVAPGMFSRATRSPRNESTDSPVGRFVSTLIDDDPRAI
jgi:hypothetical protein